MLPISPAWEKAAEEVIEASGIVKEPSQFAGKVFRKQFFPTIASVYFDDLLSQTKQDLVAVGEQLLVDKGTISRWVSGQARPNGDKFFAVVMLILGRNLNSIPFSNWSVLQFRSFRRQTEDFAQQFCEEAPTCEFSKLVFRGLMYAMGHPSSDKLVPGNGQSEETIQLHLGRSTQYVSACLARDFNNQSNRGLTAFPKAPQIDPKQLHDWYVSWGMAYTLFAIGTKESIWELSNE